MQHVPELKRRSALDWKGLATTLLASACAFSCVFGCAAASDDSGADDGLGAAGSAGASALAGTQALAGVSGVAASSAGTTAGTITGGEGGVGGAGGASGTGNPGASSGASGASGAGAAEAGSASGVGGSSGAAGMSGMSGAGNAGNAGTEATPVTCPTPALSAGNTTRMITVGSSMRSYELHVPSAYDGAAPAPLVVDFHPLGGSGPSELGSSPYPAQTDPEGVIMAFPSGLRGPSGGAWDLGPCCVDEADDVAFAKALVEDVASVACIDEKRVYAVGFSMGGGMSHHLACHAADVFAAVAPAAFDLLEETVADCVPARPIGVIAFRGTGDGIVPYAGGYSPVVPGMPITFLGAMDTFTKWAEINQCTGSASAPDGDDCIAHTQCAGGVEVILCTQGGGHAPGDASIGWPALKRHSLP